MAIAPPVESLVVDSLNDTWVTDQKTFNYKLPCSIEATPAVVVVVHGINRRQRVMIGLDRMGRNYISDESVSIAYPRLTDFCVAIATPKSGVLVPFFGRYSNYYRTWWMTEGVVDAKTLLPVINEAEEINSIIDLINIAKEAVNAPVYLLMGNDSGVLANKVLDALKSDGNSDLISGFVLVQRILKIPTIYSWNLDVWSRRSGKCMQSGSRNPVTILIMWLLGIQIMACRI
jgi:hypothetical protein